MVKRGLWKLGPAPQALIDFEVERAFWNMLGISADTLDHWPVEKVDQYLVMMREVTLFEEAEKNAKNR
jgi:hypothetical protein